ncbi:MAG TPA: RNA-binding cell elongation regulator Jag/EloR [Gaiellaceae bacterium]|jgi:spoIIIJ-associated protein
MSEPHQVEATGETVGEAKWQALRELERLLPGLDKSAVRFEVVSEGERGLLGVGYAPARVTATVDAAAVPAPPTASGDESTLAADLRDLLGRIVAALGVDCRIDVGEDDETVTASLTGGDLGLLIGRHGQTIDAIQYLASAVAYRTYGDDRKDVVVDAAGYRDRRRETLEALAVRSARRATSTGEPVELEPMSSIERRIVHLRLQDEPGVGTRSEGDEPYRYVVVEPD